MKTMRFALLAALVAFYVGCAQTVNDSSITAQVKSKLASDAGTSATRINVDTEGGVVTLSGIVPTTAEKERAEQMAGTTEGVKRVMNNITVDARTSGATGSAPTGSGIGDGPSDTTILTKIKTQFLTEGIVGTNVDVNNGHVLLKGNVESPQEKTQAETIARKTEGVRDVTNQLTVKRAS